MCLVKCSLLANPLLQMSQRWVLSVGELADFKLGGVSFLMTAAAWLSGSPWDSALTEEPPV